MSRKNGEQKRKNSLQKQSENLQAAAYYGVLTVYGIVFVSLQKIFNFLPINSCYEIGIF